MRGEVECDFFAVISALFRPLNLKKKVVDVMADSNVGSNASGHERLHYFDHSPDTISSVMFCL